MVFASRSNRCLRAASEENCSGKILIATVRPRRVSRARYTSPIPPAPSGETISYGPSLAPRVSATGLKLYLAKENAGEQLFTDAFFGVRRSIIEKRQVVSAPLALGEHSLARTPVRLVRQRRHREKRPRFRSSRQHVRQELRCR